MRRILSLVVLVLASACSGGSAAPIPGPTVMGVVAGNHQVVPAARDAVLPQRVDVQVYIGPNGQVSMRSRVVDALLPEQAYAQTIVTGVPNQVVCASAPDPKHALRAEVACANSDAQGHATFVFHNDSVAGTSRAQVAAALPTGTKITDSVSATVLAGTANPNYLAPTTPYMNFPATVPDISVVDAFGNAVAFRIVSDGRIVVQDTTTGSIGARTIVSGPNAQADYIVELRGAGNVLVGHARYRVTGNQLAWFVAGGVNTTP